MAGEQGGVDLGRVGAIAGGCGPADRLGVAYGRRQRQGAPAGRGRDITGSETDPK
jgi:hypothetical protein